MKLDDPTVRRLLIGAAIVIVVLFIIMKIYQRSYYKYPNLVENATLNITGVSLTAASGPTPAFITFTTGTTAHGYAPGDLVVIYGTGLTFSNTKGLTDTSNFATTFPTGSIIVPVRTTPTLTTFTIEGSFTGTFTQTNAKVESPAKGIKTTLDTALLQCQNKYALDVIQGVPTRDDDRTTCIRNAVSTYSTNHCKWSVSSNVPTLAADPTANVAYQEYQTDLMKIQAAYAFAAQRAAAGTFTGVSDTAKATDIVKKARQADMLGATRRYLAKACPGFYQPGNPTASDPTTRYKSWSISAAATKPTTAGSYGFWSSVPDATQSTTTGVRDSDILTWAEYAGNVTLTNGVLASSGGLVSNIGITGRSDKSGLGGLGNENWRKAYENGPGTFVAPTYTNPPT